MHKQTILFLRLWITFASLGAFLFGWIVLAHSAKPASLWADDILQPPAALALPPLAPLPTPGQPGSRLRPLPGLPAAPSLSGAPSSPGPSSLPGTLNLPAQPYKFSNVPRLRTRGS